MKKIIAIIAIFVLNIGLVSFGSIKFKESISSTVMVRSFDDQGNEIFGTGFFMSVDSYILTVSHIIFDEKNQKPFPNIQICTIENEYSKPFCKYSAKVIAYDTDYDLAIIVPEYYLNNDKTIGDRKVNINSLNHSFIDMADELPRMGEKISILGFPNASQLTSITLTEGIVSGFAIDNEGYVNEIATDATINPGNSGGPVLNAVEKAIGIVVAISTDGIGGNYGYIISNDLIKAWFMELSYQDILNPDFVYEIFYNDSLNDLYDDFLLLEGEKVFTDVDFSHKYAFAIKFLKNYQILNGYSDGSFRPENEINRAELLKVLVMGAGHSPSNAYKNCFPDVKEDWYAPYVCFAKLNNWVEGYQDGNFRPEKPVSKAEAVKMILTVFEINFIKDAYEYFRDVKPDSWFFDYITTAYILEIIDDVDLFFLPNSNILRGQASEYIFRSFAL